MRIAFYISPVNTVPSTQNKILAPWVLAEHIINGLVAAGHEVTVFGAIGSNVPCPLVTLGIEPFLTRKSVDSPRVYYHNAIFQEARLAGEAVARANAGDFDVIHIFHGTLRVLPVLRFSHVPVICTIHDPFIPNELPLYEAYAHQPQIQYVAISDVQKRFAPALSFAGIVYNGVNTKEIPVGTTPPEYLLMLGRIRPEKGFTTGIAAAKAAGVPIIIGGEYFLDDSVGGKYWKDEVAPLVDDTTVRFAGMKEHAGLWDLYGRAKALLFPIGWEEPFGMVMIEAMACGTPVIAYNRGSVSEVVNDGVTGFIIDPPVEDDSATRDTLRKASGQAGHATGNMIIKTRGIEGLVEAIRRISEIKRCACRAHIEAHFTVNTMVAGYEQLYTQLLTK